MRAALLVARRELAGYFATPVAYVFIVIFLMMAGAMTFSLGGFFARGQADLGPFFGFVPWLFLFLVPALTMRLWAEERRLGTIELLLTLPMAQWQAVLGKFLAAWAFCAIALALTFPLVMTVNFLGRPDNGVIAAGYGACLLMAGAYLAIGSHVGHDQEPGNCLCTGRRGVFPVCGRRQRPGDGFPKPAHPCPGRNCARTIADGTLQWPHARGDCAARCGVLRLLHRVLAFRECGGD